MWLQGLREPGLVWWPGKIAPQVRQEVASTLDVFGKYTGHHPGHRGCCIEFVCACSDGGGRHWCPTADG